MEIKTTIAYKGKVSDLHNELAALGYQILVQTRKNNSKYTTKCSFTGNLIEALFYYRCINCGYGWSKRLICPQYSKKPICRSLN